MRPIDNPYEIRYNLMLILVFSSLKKALLCGFLIK